MGCQGCSSPHSCPPLGGGIQEAARGIGSEGSAFGLSALAETIGSKRQFGTTHITRNPHTVSPVFFLLIYSSKVYKYSHTQNVLKNPSCLRKHSFLSASPVSRRCVLHCALYSVFLLETEAAGLSTVTSDPLRPREGELTVWNS